MSFAWAYGSVTAIQDLNGQVRFLPLPPVPLGHNLYAGERSILNDPPAQPVSLKEYQEPNRPRRGFRAQKGVRYDDPPGFKPPQPKKQRNKRHPI